MTIDFTFRILGLVTITSPAALLTIFAASALFSSNLSERAQEWLTKLTIAIGLGSAIGILGMMLAFDLRHVPIDIGDWVAIPEEHFHFHLKFVFDRLSVPFVILSFVLCGTVGAFASVYLHREPGHSRFFLLYALFLLGMVVSSLAGTIETLFLGWELVGLSSALLIAYFHERAGPVRNGQRVWAIYRAADAAFLVAALTLHSMTGAGDFEELMGVGSWPEGVSAIDSSAALLVGGLLLVAAAGKSGMVPFSGWLPRAMEGPTPSSAIFYGALSIHLGPFLLLRVSPLIAASVPLQLAVLATGLASAIFGSVASRAQTDVKSALAFASLTQVGIIAIEIGFGLYYIALIHMIGHACLRTLQLLRAPSVLKDYQLLEDAMGLHIGDVRESDASNPRTPPRGLFRFAFERGYLDAMLDRVVVGPFVSFFRWCDRVEHAVASMLSGESSHEPRPVVPYPRSLEDST